MPDSVEQRIDAIACWGSCQGDFDRTDDILWLATLGSKAYAALDQIVEAGHTCCDLPSCDHLACRDKFNAYEVALNGLAEIRAADGEDG